MAGANITIDYNADGALRSVFSLIDVLVNPTPMFQDMGEALTNITVDRWDTQAAPDGTPWAALSARYARRKEKARPGAPILVYDNLLRSTLRYQADAEGLRFGSDRPYAASQQFGRGNIPARPWLGTNAADDAQLVQIAFKHLQLALGKS